nr:proliferation marker protein Ki-67 isoform X1 [Meriones unguiculatus]XP_021492466.1 proliferation marker protein Ki-67 isoform X3 [Meriones unguiculatus]
MESSARLVTIKRNGDDGAHFPLSLSSCLFGRSIECDIRIQLPVVSKKHCKIQVKEQEAILYNFSSTNPTQVNGATIDEPVQLKHGDIITIIDRSFRYENLSHEDGHKSTEFPGKSLGQEPARRASRASFSADPDGKGQDAKASEITASGRSVVNAETLTGDSPASGGSKDNVTQDLSGHLEQHSSRESTSGDISKKSKATGSSYRKLKSSPAQSLSNSKKNESPFKELYQSLKEQLVVKSQKHRKSEPQPHRAGGKESETQLLVSCKARPKSSGNIPVTATSSPEVEMICTEKQTGGGESVQTPMEALNSSFSLSETAKTKTPVRKSQQLKDEDFHAIGGKESVNPGESEGAKAVHKIITPRKLLTRNQTSVKVEDAASLVDAPENPSSRKRSSFSARVEVLPADTQKRLSSTPCLASGEKKTPKNAFSKPEKLATAAEQICSGLPGLSSVDISNFGDSINKSEGMSLKRRRVSFGGCLRPELFDENLPPNTPLKRGETPAKRKSLATHSPAVLKKIIKEPPKSPRQQESAGGTPTRANDQRRGSVRTSPASSGSKSLYQTDTPKKSGRKSNNLPAKRASISRGQHGILQMISSKRRSGASEANLIVKKSWADVVKLGAKQTQMKVVKHAPQKQMSKRQRRPTTPKKPTSNLHNQFSTGHANSPCTIVIGRTQIEKVSMPAQPYKMLSNLMLNRKMDFSEDLSGLTEMFKTPVKEKQQQMTDMGSILPNSENLPEKQFQATSSGGTPLPITSEILGENVPSSTQNAAKEPSDTYSASPTLKRRSIKNGSRVQTPKNVHNITHLEKKTPGSDTELLETASSVSRTRRSRQLRHTLEDSMNEKTEADLADGITGKHLRKTSLRGQEVDQQVQDCENSSQRCKENTKLKEGPEKTLAMRSSAREQKLAKDLIRSQMVTQTEVCAEELLNQEQGTTHNPEESMHTQSTPEGDGQEATKQKVDPAVNAAKVKCCLKTPDKKTQLLQGPAGLKETFETPNCRDELIEDYETKVPCKYPQLTAENTRTSAKARSSMSGKKADVKKELPALTKLVHVSGGARHSPKVPELEHGDIKALNKYESKMLTPTITRSRRSLRKTEEKPQLLEDLTGFQELFLSPVPGDKIIKMPSESPYSEPVRTPASTKRLSKMGRRVNVRELSVLEKESPSRAAGTPAPLQKENDTTVFMETPKQKLDFTGNSVRSKRRSRTPKIRAQPLEDLAGFPELFQTPVGASDPVTVGETTKMSRDSPQPEPVRTPASTKRLSKTGLRQLDVKEEFSTVGKRTKSPGRATGTPAAVQEETSTTVFMKTPRQKLDSTGNSTGHKQRSRTPKIRTQPLEDLAGFPELFQTPVGASDPVTVGETSKMSRESLQPEPVRTPKTKRPSKTGLVEVDVREELSADGKRTKSPGRKTRTPMAPVQEDNDATVFMETPRQKLDFTENSTGHKRRSRTPKIRTQPLEDLDGFQELFQTPVGASDPVTVGESTKMSLESSEPGHTRTQANTKTLSKTGLGKVDVKEEPSTLGKQTASPGRATRTLRTPVQKENDATSFMETPKQKLDFTGNSVRSKRRSRTPKIRAQPLEDLAGFPELFQTPVGASDPVTVGETTKMSRDSPQPEPVKTPASTKRLSKMSHGKVDVKKELSPLNKPRCASQEFMHAPRLPVDDGRGAKDVKKSVAQTLDPPVHVTRSKRQQGACKKRSQSPEDLSGLQELFQTPGHDKISVAGNKPTKMSSRFLPLEPKDTSVTSQRQPKINLRNLVKNEVSGDRMLPQISGEILGSPRVPESEGRVIRTRKQPVKRKLDTAVSVPDSKRQRVARAEKAQTRGHLSGVQELYQDPGLSMDSVTVDKTTKMPNKSPEPVEMMLETQPGRRLRRLGVAEEPRVQRKTTRVVRETRNTQKKEPMGDSKGVKEFKESSMQKQDPAVSLTGKRNQPRTAKKTQPLEELISFQEETSVRMSCQSPQSEEKETSAASKRLFRTQLCKVDVKEEPTTQRKPPGRETRSTLKEPVGDAINVEEELKASTKRKIDLATSMPVNKRPRRVPREKAQSLELAGLKGPIQTPGHTEESVSDKRSTQMPCNFPQTEQVGSLQISPRRPRTRRGKVEVNEEPSVLKKTMPTSRQTMRSCKVPEIDDKGTEVSKESVKQKLDTEANVTGSRRRPRAQKDEVQPLEVLSDSKEITQISDHPEKLRHDTQMPDSGKPLRTCRRVLRTSKEEPMEMSVDTRELAASQIKSNTFLPPKRTSARDGSVSRARVLRSVTQKQEATDEKPVPKTQRSARSKRHVSPEPVKKRHLRIMSNKIEPVEEQISNFRKTEEKEDKGENSVTPDQKTPQSSRYRKKTNEKHLRPKIDGSAEKVGITKNEKTIKSSQETELQNPDDGAKKSTSRGRASGKRTCLKSRGQSEIPQPYASEEKTHEPDMEIVIKTQKERGVSGHSNVRSLRSKKAGATLDTELKPRVTRGAKKDAKVPKQDEDIVYTRKLRTRSHQNSENK